MWQAWTKLQSCTINNTQKTLRNVINYMRQPLYCLYWNLVHFCKKNFFMLIVSLYVNSTQTWTPNISCEHITQFVSPQGSQDDLINIVLSYYVFSISLSNRVMILNKIYWYIFVRNVVHYHPVPIMFDISLASCQVRILRNWFCFTLINWQKLRWLLVPKPSPLQMIDWASVRASYLEEEKDHQIWGYCDDELQVIK